ncbi:Uma2 family endonuclease [Synechococcus sp. PCC 6312]|uniref:Uma2 family endonuclease n=1 Tax=Synechococcus sp. (strain ATCC 27167 / PCC 6312) TaxID=195253 RepID=UPI00029F444A|nr:Uma2 family endonuclease [Synechococcus sp. PCC 6312]AFY61996.1 hypothetical protein Syn6312_2936 [Synechococcus sp. PCC 6312]
MKQPIYPDETVVTVDYPEDDGKPMAEGDSQCDYLTYARQVLRAFFAKRDDVYVAGNLFIYYEQGNPEAVVAPDTFVIFGVSPENRRSYKVWEEGGHCPSFVLEITSKSTVSQDMGAKKGIYAYLGVQEYFLFDPTSDYLSPPLQGWVLDQANYFPIVADPLAKGYSLRSQVLGLELHWDETEFRFL